MFKEKYMADNEMIVPSDELIASISTKMKAFDPSKEKICFTLRKRMFYQQRVKRYNTLFASFLIFALSLSTFFLVIQKGSGPKKEMSDARLDISAQESESILSKEDSSSIAELPSSEESFTLDAGLSPQDILDNLVEDNITHITVSLNTQSNQDIIEDAASIHLVLDLLKEVELYDESATSPTDEDAAITYLLLFNDNTSIYFSILGECININGTWYNANPSNLEPLITFYAKHNDYIRE